MNLLPRPRSVDFGDARGPNRIATERIDPALPAQGYELRIDENGAGIVAADEAGAFYARATLAQLARLHEGELPVGTISDHPDIAVRGVMIDISRDKVPTMDTLRALIDRLASWKVNHVQLYSEHTFAYRNHPEVNAAASPISADEIRELDAFCRARHVELTPNQNCLGHMNRWLKHARYNALAVAPDGFTDPWGTTRAPMTVDPTKPGALPLFKELLGELLPLFTSRRVNVGLDETWELPRERLGDYLAWVATLRALPELDGRDMLMWGDMVAGDAGLIGQLPAGVTICEWGYEASHPFDERTRVLAEAGVPFWVSPGTSSWLTILGRVTNATENCRNAAAAARAHGGSGFLNTDWGDQGHLQQLPISDPGLAYGAAVSWCLDTNADIDLGEALSAHAYDDATGEFAAALLAVGDAYRVVTPQLMNMSALATNLYWPQLSVGRGFTRGVTVDELDRLDALLDESRARIDRARIGRGDAAQLVDELRWCIDVVRLLSRDQRARLNGDGRLQSIPAEARAALADELDALTDTHRALWLARNRSGGLDDSVAWLENLTAAYRSGEPDPEWAGLKIRS